MIRKSDLVSIGNLGRTHGVDGEITARMTIDGEDFLSLYESHSPIFIFAELDGLLVPFCIDDLRTKGDDLFLIKFSHICNKEDAQKLVNAPLYIETKYLPEGLSFTPQHFVGFELRDGKDQSIGTIVAVDDETLNILFSVERQDGTLVLIPLADELLHYIDSEERIISINLPEGILDI